MFVGVNTRSGHRPLFQPHTNIASLWDAPSSPTPFLQTWRPHGTRDTTDHTYRKQAYGPRKKSISLYQTSYGCPPNLSFRQYAVRLTNRSQRDQLCSTIIERRKPSQRDGTFVAQS